MSNEITVEVQNMTKQINVEIDNTTAISKLQAKIERLETQISELTGEVETLRLQKDELETQVANLQIEIAEQVEQINSLTSEKERLEEQIGILESNIASLSAQITALTLEKEETENKLDELNGEQVENKANYALESKSLIASAIKNKGGTITDNTTFRQYANIIKNLPIKRTGDKHTLLLLPFNSSANTDMSIYEREVTAVGEPQIQSEQTSPFGESCLYLDGSQYLYVNDFYPLMTRSWTFELWYKPSIDYTDYRMGFFCIEEWVSSNEYYHLFEYLNGYQYIELYTQTSHPRNYTSISFNTSSWNHIAIVRNSSVTGTYNVSLYLNGIRKSWTSMSYINSIYSYNMLATAFYLFCFHWSHDNTVGRQLRGHVSNLRISDIARYSGSRFNVPTQPFSI